MLWTIFTKHSLIPTGEKSLKSSRNRIYQSMKSWNTSTSPKLRCRTIWIFWSERIWWLMRKEDSLSFILSMWVCLKNLWRDFLIFWKKTLLKHKQILFINIFTMKHLLWLRIGLVGILFLLGAFLYDSLPESVPTHWGPSGLPDAYGDKAWNLFFFPFLILLIVLAFPFLSKLDPKKENYEKFAGTWEIFQMSIISFFVYVQCVILYLSFHPEVSITKFMMFGLGVLFLIIGNYMGKIRQNYFIGIKLPWTLSSEVVWNKTHRLGGKLFVLAGLLFLVNGFVNWYPLWMFVILLVLVVFVPIGYSYMEFKRQSHKVS